MGETDEREGKCWRVGMGAGLGLQAEAVGMYTIKGATEAKRKGTRSGSDQFEPR